MKKRKRKSKSCKCRPECGQEEENDDKISVYDHRLGSNVRKGKNAKSRSDGKLHRSNLVTRRIHWALLFPSIPSSPSLHSPVVLQSSSGWTNTRP